MVLVKIQHKTVCVGTLNSEGLLQSKITTREDKVTGIQRTTISTISDIVIRCCMACIQMMIMEKS